MLTLTYTAMDGNGREQTGSVKAENERAAAMRLKQMGLFPTNIREARSAQARAAKRAGAGFRLKDLTSITIGAPVVRKKELTVVTRQLATLLDAGLPLVRALRTLQKQAKKDPPLRRVLRDLADAVEGGSTFSEALGAHPKSFTKLYVNMVRAGEASGAMETVLNRLAGFMEKAARTAGKVEAALVYPVIVLLVATTITSGLMIFIVPRFAKIFNEMLNGKPLPFLTRAVVEVSNVMKEHAGLLALGVIAGLVACQLARRTKVGGYAADYALAKLPAVSQLTVKSVVARFSRTLGTLMQSGVGILDALRIVRDTAGNHVFGHAIQAVHDAVKEGEGMSAPLEHTGVFPGMVVSMVEVGEETGALPEMLNRIADVYEEEAYTFRVTLRDPDKFPAWLFSIARNLARDVLRRRRPHLPLADAPAAEVSAEGPPQPAPDWLLEAAERLRIVQTALAGLPERHRKALEMRYLRGMDYRSIQDDMGISNGALRGVLGRALGSLRRKLRSIGFE